MYKALIIDDEKPARQAIAALGEWKKHNIDRPIFACDGSAGLRALRETAPDIVFVDMKMPLVDGPAFLKEAAVEYPLTQYIVISGYNEFEFARTALKFRVLDYLLKPIDEEELDAVLGKAVSQLNTQAHDKPIPDKTEVILSVEEITLLIKNHIEKHYSKEINLGMFAEQYHFSKEYLSKIFKEKNGFGIYEYALRLRMERAHELLNDGELHIYEIAERLGYKDSSYFSKAFRNFFGYWPSEFRNTT